MGVDGDKDPVLEGARLPLIHIGDDIPGKGGVLPDGIPLAAGGETGAPETPEAGIKDNLPDLSGRMIFQGPGQTLIAAVLKIRIQRDRLVL